MRWMPIAVAALLVAGCRERFATTYATFADAERAGTAAALNYYKYYTLAMDRITTLDLRAHMGELLDRVRLRFESFVVERKGRAVAAIIPAERLRRVEEFARRRAAELEAIQDERVEARRQGAEEVERAIAGAARDVKAKRRARRK
jgi:prevent-host-death family protein